MHIIEAAAELVYRVEFNRFVVLLPELPVFVLAVGGYGFKASRHFFYAGNHVTLTRKSSRMDLQTVGTFFNTAWSVYDTALERNYMYHREIYAGVLDQLQTCPAGQYTLLDLGCGSAKTFAPVLAQHPPLRYVGVDLSATALAEAATWLRPHGFGVELHEGDLFDFIQQTPPASFDVVFAGFALHHLLKADKQTAFHHAHRTLKPGGFFLMPDAVRYEDETRDLYLERYVRNVQTTWTALSPPQMEAVIEHITGQDYPERPSTLARMAKEAGFSRSQELARFGHHATWRFDA